MASAIRGRTQGIIRSPVPSNFKMWELILDEASQIPGFCTFSILHTFPDLQKLVIVGDPKQLRPYGSQDTRGISSAFDVFKAHLEPIFLDVQFRMPKPIADILSRLAYNGRLKTAEEKAAGPSCIQWVDVPKSRRGRLKPTRRKCKPSFASSGRESSRNLAQKQRCFHFTKSRPPESESPGRC